MVFSNMTFLQIIYLQQMIIVLLLVCESEDYFGIKHASILEHDFS